MTASKRQPTSGTIVRRVVGAAGLLLVTLWLGAIFTPGPAAAEQSREEYRAALEQALTDLRSGNPETAPPVAERLRALDAVRLPDGRVITPDLSPILRALEIRPPQVALARQRLEAVLAEIDRPVPGGRSPVAAREALDRVLARPEFGDGTPDHPIARWLYETRENLRRQVERITDAIGEALDDLTRQVPGDTGPGAVFRNLLAQLREWTGPVQAVVGLVFVAGLVVFVAWALRRSWGSSLVALPEERTPRRDTAARLRDEAARMAQAGDFRAAVRALYLAVLLRWDETGRLHFDRSLTNREVLARAGGREGEPLADQLRPLVERFDRVWYAGLPCSADDYTEFDRLARRAWDLA